MQRKLRSATFLLCLLLSPTTVWGQASAPPRTLEENDRAAKPRDLTPNFQLWFCPSGATDVAELFRKPEQWRYAATKIDVFEVYLKYFSQPPLWQDLERSKALEKLRSWDVRLAVEASPIPGHRVNQHTAIEAAAAHAEEAVTGLSRVRQAGSRVLYLSMDEPVFKGGPTGCNYGFPQTVAAVARFAGDVKREFPDLQIGDIEPYPAVGIPTLKAWVTALEEHHVRLAFLHLDINFYYLSLHPQQMRTLGRDLNEMKRFCRAHAIPFGVIFWSGKERISDQEYCDMTLANVARVKAAMGVPNHCIFQSWCHDIQGKGMPQNLPETARFTHTSLLNQGFARLIDDAAVCRVVSAPGTVKPGQEFQVVVSAENRGPLAWTKRRGYGLGCLEAQGDGFREVRRAPLGEKEAIRPGSVKEFHFSLQAPTNPGTYEFRCRMVEQLGKWFGEPTEAMRIRVQP